MSSSASVPAPAASDGQRLENAAGLCKHYFNLIRFADQKAQFLLRIVLALFGAAFIGVPPAVLSLNRFAAAGGWKVALFIGVLVLYATCAFLLLASIMKLVAVVRPRNWTTDQFSNHTHFEQVATTAGNAFRDRMRSTDCEGMIDELVAQAHGSARVAAEKYRLLNQAINWMLGGGLTGVVFALILLVSMGFVESPSDLQAMGLEPPAAQPLPHSTVTTQPPAPTFNP